MSVITYEYELYLCRKFSFYFFNLTLTLSEVAGWRSYHINPLIAIL